MASPDRHIHSAGLASDAATRRFILAVLLTTRYHLTSRPISPANDVYYSKLATCSDGVLAALKRPGWDPLSAIQEEGIRALEFTSAWPAGPGSARILAERFGSDFRKYFRGLNLPWSKLGRVDQMTLAEWPSPRHIFFSVGPNIGIGDELLFSDVAARLTRQYPDATLEVSSFNRSLWDRMPFADCVHYESVDQLAPFARARQLIAHDESALLVFVEFASAHMYRHLEVAPGFPRFVYLDTGGRLVRLVDQARNVLMEHICMGDYSVYADLAECLEHIGLPAGERPSWRTGGTRRAPARRPRVFVNPFTSKDVGKLPPTWWAECLNEASRAGPLHVEMFDGINAWTREYAQALTRALDHGSISVSHFGGDDVPSIGATLDAVRNCDLVFGIDTFTSHFAYLEAIPCVTVFVGSFWHAWRTPSDCAFTASVHDDPQVVGGLLALLNDRAPAATEPELAQALLDGAERVYISLLDGNRTAAAAALDESARYAARLLAANPRAAAVLNDVPLDYFQAFRSSLLASFDGAPADRAFTTLANHARREWSASNLYRYARFLAAHQLSAISSQRSVSRTRGASPEPLPLRAES
jgi:hypothetical protein